MGGLFKKVADTTATIAGGPVAGALTSFGTSALSGGNFYDSLSSGITGGVAGSAAKKMPGKFGAKLKEGLGLGNTTDTLNTLNSSVIAPMGSTLSTQEEPMLDGLSLLDTLRQRRIDNGI